MAFIAAIILLARPITVYLSLLGTKIPRSECTLVAFTGPRGVVLVVVAGLFGEWLVALGIADGAMMAPFAFGLVAVTVVLHGFTLTPVARALGLSGEDTPGVLIVGGTSLGTQLGALLRDLDVPVVISDTNHRNLHSAHDLDVSVFYGDVLSEVAEHMLELHRYDYTIALRENEPITPLSQRIWPLNLGATIFSNCAVIANTAAAMNCPQPLGGGLFWGMKPIPVVWTKSCWIGGWVSHGSARNIH